MRPFLDHFKFGACFSLSLPLHSLENLVTACCFPDFSAHLSKFLQLKFRESVQFANIAKILPRENFLFYGMCTVSQDGGEYMYNVMHGGVKQGILKHGVISCRFLIIRSK